MEWEIMKEGERREWYRRERRKEANRQWNRKKGERNSEIGEACRIERTVEDRGAVVGEDRGAVVGEDRGAVVGGGVGEDEEGEGKYKLDVECRFT